MRGGTFHLLRLVHNDNRAVCCKDINRFATCKFIAFGIDNLAFFIVRALFHGTGERLRVDNHHVDSDIARIGINLLQVRTVIDEPFGFFAVVFKEMRFKHLETFGDAFADGDTRHDDNKLAPAITFVQFEHRLDIDIRLAGTGFHFDVKVHKSKILVQLFRFLDVVFELELADIFKKIALGLHQFVVAVALIVFEPKHRRIDLADIATVQGLINTGFAIEHAGDAFHRVGLVLLNLELEFHYSTFLMVSLL